MALVKTVPFALLATLALTAAHRPPPPPAAPPAASVVAPTIRTGVEKWRAGDYAAAVAIWQPFANAGEPDALFNLGQAYKLGRGVPADAATARDYYRKAAVKGHLPAQANLGIALFQAGEKPEAIKWLKTAADRGEARAQYVLGIAAFNGDGVPRSQSLGYGYLLRAQASGLPQAVTALGSIAPGLSPTDRTAGEAVAASLAAGTGVPAGLASGSTTRATGIFPPARTATLPVVTPPPATTIPTTGPATPPGQVAASSVPRPGTPPATVAASPASTATGAGSGVAAPSSPRTADRAVPADRTAPAAVAIAATAPRLSVPAAAGQGATPGTASPAAAPPRPATTTAVPIIAPATGMAPRAVATVGAPTTAPIAGAPRSTVTGGGPAPAGSVPRAAATAMALPPAPHPAPAAPLREPTPAQADAAAGAPPRPAVATVEIPASRPVDPASRPEAARADPLAPPRVAARTGEPGAARPSSGSAPLKPFEVAATPARKPDGWRVQLGAFSARRLADAAWNDVKATAAPAKPIFATDGPVTKLQMGPFPTRDAAKAACTKLTAAGRACFVTAG